MSYSTGLSDSRAISQSDSNLLSSRFDQGNVGLRRNQSVDDIDMETKRSKGFFYKLVRPWKWHRKKKKNSKAGDQNSGELMFKMLGWII